jgi:dUTP pyrophosphatase
MSLSLRIKQLPHGKGLPLPSRQTEHSAGLDLVCAIAGELTLAPMQIALVPCGFAMEIPPGFEGQVRPRSGLSSKHGITLVNCVGTIDSDYRGEVKVPLINLGPTGYLLRRGDRIAQLVIMPVLQVTVIQVDELSDTARGEGGFGHTGTR